MNAYNPISWKKKLVFAVATIAIAVGSLEIVTSSMKYPAPESMAVREQVIAAEAARAQQIRELEQGEVRLADTATGSRF